MPGEHILVVDDSPTLLRIAARALSRAGYKVRTAEGGAKGISLAKRERPDLIVLDYLMPGLNGEQVCRILGQDPVIREVPVIMMSARAEAIGPRFVEELGAVDYISKPFSPEALVAVTSHAIDKFIREGTPSPRGTRQEDSQPSGPSRSEIESKERPRHLAAVRAQIAARLVPALGDAIAGVDAGGGPEALRGAIESALGDAYNEVALRDLARELIPAFPEEGLPDQTVLVGDLAAVAIADAVQMLQFQKQTGIFSVQHLEHRVTIYFRDGRVDWVGGRNLRDEFLLGRFLVDCGAISRQDLDLFLQSRSGTRKLLGSQLVKLGYIAPDHLRQALLQQSSEIIYEILRWRTGRFAFRVSPERPTHVEGASLGLGLEQLLMEGFRRVDEWSVIEKVIHSPDIVFQRNEEAVQTFGFESLEEAEIVILELVDGQQRVGDIISHSRMSSFEVCKLLYRLHAAKLVRKIVEPAAPGAIGA